MFNDFQLLYRSQIFVDIPSQLEASSSSCRGRSPATPKRTRSQFNDKDSSFDGLSPIGSPKLCGFSPDFEPMSTPKRRKASNTVLRSSVGDFGAALHRPAPLSQAEGLSKSVDFSKIPSFKVATNQYSTPKKRSKSDACLDPPSAPRKTRRSQRIEPEELPLPQRLFEEMLGPKPAPENVPASNIASNIDYVGAMGVVGFISSHLARTGDRQVALSELVQVISSGSVSHRSASSALVALGDLARAVPEWISVDRSAGSVDMYWFNPEVRAMHVLQKLREMKRKQTMEETADLRQSIAELRASVSRLNSH